jgi:hypothetical protein
MVVLVQVSSRYRLFYSFNNNNLIIIQTRSIQNQPFTLSSIVKKIYTSTVIQNIHDTNSIVVQTKKE